MSDLASKHCVPCEGGTPSMPLDQAREMLKEIGHGWKLEEGIVPALSKEWVFKDFKESMDFLNAVAQIAESEGHHPDMHCFYNKVRLNLSTHAVHGLSDNDFILAAKINELPMAKNA